MFEALSDAQLEIHTGMMASAILSDKIPCARLKIENKSPVDRTFPEARVPKDLDLVVSSAIAATARAE